MLKECADSDAADDDAVRPGRTTVLQPHTQSLVGSAWASWGLNTADAEMQQKTHSNSIELTNYSAVEEEEVERMCRRDKKSLRKVEKMGRENKLCECE